MQIADKLWEILELAWLIILAAVAVGKGTGVRLQERAKAASAWLIATVPVPRWLLALAGFLVPTGSWTHGW